MADDTTGGTGNTGAVSAAGPHPLRTSIYIPGDLVPAVDRARAAGKSYADLIRDGLAAMDPGEHEHAYQCAICGSAPEASLVLESENGENAQQAMAELLAAERRRSAELEEILESGDRQGDNDQAALDALRQKLEQAEAGRSEALKALGPLEDRVRELEARLSEAAEAAQDGEAAAITSAAAAEAENRSWRSWAGAVCQALGITDAQQVIPWINELRGSGRQPPAAVPMGLAPDDDPDDIERVPLPFSTAMHDQAGAIARARLAEQLGPPLREAEDLPPLDDSAWISGGQDTGEPGDDWPSSFDEEGDGQ